MSLQQTVSRISGVSMREITNGEQTVVSFRAGATCGEEQLEQAYRAIIGNILSGRDVVVVTKDAGLLDVISDEVGAADKARVQQRAVEVARFTPEDSGTEHRATLVADVPAAVVEDLATSSEFVYGNLWILVSSGADVEELRGDVVGDVNKLTPSAFEQLPTLRCEAVAAPAMYDGLELLWFKPDRRVYQPLIKPMFA